MCFDQALLKPFTVPVPVISVGNLAAGGTGKTSLVMWLAERLNQPAILIRGYRSQLERQMPQLIDHTTCVSVCGDEAALLARMDKRPLVFVGKNRKLSAQMATDARAKVIILDDGMQYRYLDRQFEIVLVTRHDLEGKSFLREHPKALKRADLVVLMAQDDKNVSNVLLSKLNRFTKAPICGVQYELPSMKGEQIAAFCAIGRPQQFFDSLRRAGAEIMATRVKPDHRTFLPSELNALAKKAKGARMLVCTAKDRVKIVSDDLDLPLKVAHAKLKFLFGKEHLERIMYEVMD